MNCFLKEGDQKVIFDQMFNIEQCSIKKNPVQKCHLFLVILVPNVKIVFLPKRNSEQRVLNCFLRERDQKYIFDQLFNKEQSPTEKNPVQKCHHFLVILVPNVKIIFLQKRNSEQRVLNCFLIERDQKYIFDQLFNKEQCPIEKNPDKKCHLFLVILVPKNDFFAKAKFRAKGFELLSDRKGPEVYF